MGDFNYPTTVSGAEIRIPPNVQYAIGVDGINTKVLPIGSTPNVVYRIGDGTTHPEGWENIDGNKYLDFYISTGSTGAGGDKGDTGAKGNIGDDGQDVDHVSRTTGTGAEGTTDIYTVWGDVEESINLGTFEVYNGTDGTGAGDMLSSVYDPQEISGDSFARANHTGTQTASTISDFSNSVGTETLMTGIIEIDDLVSLNTDIKKLDIIAFDYFIQGSKYNYAGNTAISPTIASGDSSTFVGVDSSGLIYSATKFTKAQKQTVLPIARLQAVQGQSGSGSDLQSPIQLSYTIGEFGYTDEDWIESAVGALYATGGTFSESSTALQVDQTSGSFYTAQRRYVEITGSSNIEASSLYNVSGTPTLQARAILVIPKYYDDGTDIVALSNNKYASHTLLRSPKADDVFILVYSNQEYASQAEAEQANIDFNIFQSQASSGLIAVARFVLKGDSTNIITIIDERPSIGGTQSAIIGTATVQQVYDNSTTPELVTDSTRGAFTVKGGTANDADLNFEGKNNAGSTTFSINGTGDIVSPTITDINTEIAKIGTVAAFEAQLT